MVRRKEDLPAREVSVRVAKKVSSADDTEPTPRPRRSTRTRRGGGKGWLVVGIVVVLLTVGWFGARAAITGLQLADNNWLATLFNIKTTKLIGETDGRVNILMMGIPGDPTHDGPNLTDTLMLASYNTNDKYLTMFSIPRDLQVTASGLGTMKINAVYETGRSQNSDGPGTLTKTVEDLTGLAIPYYLQIDFAGFKQLVDELGGVKIEVKKDLVDSSYPADSGDGVQLFEVKAGSYTMDGEMALKYARSRHSTSDFDRARRQQDLLMAIRAKASDLNLLTAPTKMLEINDIIKDHLMTNLSKDELIRVMKLLADFDPTMITNKVMDEASGLLYGGKNDAGAYVLRPVGDDYGKIETFVSETLAKSPSDQTEPEVEATPLKVEVLNGTSVTGLAGKAAEKLRTAGHTITKVANNSTKGIAKTMVYGDASLSASLQALANSLGATVSTETVTLPAGTEARVILGADYPTQ
ncbi:MAG: LCP family protein [Patescibacteria group bacterium]|jgi:LCP family protein required for cell wall assembly